MLSLIAPTNYLNIAALVITLILLCKFILDKCSPDPRFREIDSQVPGPFRWPIIGNSLSFVLAGKTGQIELHNKLIKKYGRIYRMWVGHHFVVPLSHPDDLQAIFTSSKLLGKGDIIGPLNSYLGDGLFSTMSVPFWKKNRKRLQPFFTKDVIRQLAPQLNESIYKTVNKLKKSVDGPEFEITDIIYDLSLDCITKTAYDIEISQNEKLINDIKIKTDSFVEVLTLQTFFPTFYKSIFRLFFDNVFVKPTRNFLAKSARQIVSKKLSAIQNGAYHSNGGPFSSELLLSSYNSSKDTEENMMLEEVLTIVLGAGEAPMKAITFSLFMIAMHPEVQAKAYEQIKEVFGDDDRQADMQDCDQLTYIGQIVKETLRRFTLLPTFFRQAEEDIKIGSYTFPAGTHFMVNAAGLHLNPEYYPNPYEFNPDNFTPEAVKNRHKYAFLPFGAGARNCLGKIMAELEVQLALIAILRTFTVHTTRTMKDLKLTYGVLTRNEDGIWLSFKKRNSK